jgi:branched-chain amino acid transport system permease protein
VSLGLFVITVLNALSGASILVLSALGLAVIFRMMGIINVAHGEFIMLGAYATFVFTRLLGLNIWLSMLLGTISVGIVGIFLERAIVSRLYGRPLDTLLATWGISLAVVQIVRLIFGPQAQFLFLPLAGTISLADVSFPLYRLLLMALAAAVLIVLLWVFKSTNFGIDSRAVIQSASTAAAMGIDTSKMYMLTFGIGAALAGLAGAVLSPLLNVEPTMGQKLIVRAFLVVVVGGADILGGTAVSGVILGAVDSYVSFLTTPYFGSVALLVVSILLIRVWPGGISFRSRE